MCKQEASALPTQGFAGEPQIIDLKRFGFRSQLACAKTAEPAAESIRQFAGSPAAHAAVKERTRVTEAARTRAVNPMIRRAIASAAKKERPTPDEDF